MEKSVRKNNPKRLGLDKKTIELFAAMTTNQVMTMKERLNQKREKLFKAIPFLGKIHKKIQKFDQRMEKKHGQVYTKIRDSIKNIGRTVLAAQMFGLPGVIGMCAYKTCEKAASLLEPAEKARQNGEVSGVFEYLKKNKQEAGFTMTSGALSIATTACTIVGAVGVKEAVRVGKASLLMGPEIKNLFKTTKQWLCGKVNFAEVKRDALVAGITFATYFASDMPMTRGSGKPKTEESQPKPAETQPEKAPENKTSYKDEVNQLFAAGFGNPGGIVTVPMEMKKPQAPASAEVKTEPKKEESKSDYKNEVNKLFAAGMGNPGGVITVFDIKNKKDGR